MSNIAYHRVVPENNSSAGFTEFDTIDFMLLADGRKMMKNSIRIEADVEVYSAGTTRKTPTADVRVNNMIGAHGFFDSWSCETQKNGNLQNLTSYGRYMNMVASSTLDSNDLCSGRLLAELRNPAAEGGGASIEQVVSYNDNAGHNVQTSDASFSISPSICFNRSTADYSFSQNGFIKVSCNLARNSHALYGRDASATVNYVLKNVVLKFVSVPDDGKQDKMLMQSYVSIKQTVSSTNSHIQARVPSKAVNAVSISFLTQSHENNDNKIDTYGLEAFEQIDEIQYMFNNSMSTYVTYSITDRGDMLKKGLESIVDSGHNQVSGNKLSGNKGFMVGLAFEEYIDLSSQRYSVQLQTSNAAISAAHKIAFLFFHELLSL